MNYTINKKSSKYLIPKYVDNWIEHRPYQYLVIYINEIDFNLSNLPLEPFSYRHLTSLKGNSCQVSYLIETIASNANNWFNEVIQSYINHLVGLGLNISYFIEDSSYTKEIEHWKIYTPINRNFLEFEHKRDYVKFKDIKLDNLSLDCCSSLEDKDTLFHLTRTYFYKFLSLRPNYILTYNFVFQKTLNFKRHLSIELENNDLKNLVSYLFKFLENYENVNSNKVLKSEYNKNYYNKRKGEVMSPSERNLIINLKRKENTKKNVKGVYSLAYIKNNGGLKVNGKPNYKKIGEIWDVDQRTAKRLFLELP